MRIRACKYSDDSEEFSQLVMAEEQAMRMERLRWKSEDFTFQMAERKQTHHYFRLCQEILVFDSLLLLSYHLEQTGWLWFLSFRLVRFLILASNKKKEIGGNVCCRVIQPPEQCEGNSYQLIVALVDPLQLAWFGIHLQLAAGTQIQLLLPTFQMGWHRVLKVRQLQRCLTANQVHDIGPYPPHTISLPNFVFRVPPSELSRLVRANSLRIFFFAKLKSNNTIPAHLHFFHAPLFCPDLVNVIAQFLMYSHT